MSAPCRCPGSRNSGCISCSSLRRTVQLTKIALAEIAKIKNVARFSSNRSLRGPDAVSPGGEAAAPEAASPPIRRQPSPRVRPAAPSGGGRICCNIAASAAPVPPSRGGRGRAIRRRICADARGRPSPGRWARDAASSRRPARLDRGSAGRIPSDRKRRRARRPAGLPGSRARGEGSSGGLARRTPPDRRARGRHCHRLTQRQEGEPRGRASRHAGGQGNRLVPTVPPRGQSRAFVD